MLYMIVLEGPRADQAKPVLAISDEVLIKLVLAELGRPERWDKQSTSEQTSMPGKEGGNSAKKAKMH